jgi:capsular exopolysaccharide synthesis family protein
MNRLEEALRRSKHQARLPESFAAPDVGALDRFPDAEVPPIDHSEPSAAKDVEVKSTLGGPQDDQPSPRIAPDVVSVSAPDTRALLDITSSEKSIINDVLPPLTLEQYRRLAGTLHQKQCSDGTKIVMIASALAGEGKTLTAMNLALTLSESYRRRVLLIDADLRRPRLHEVFHLPNASGLNEGLKAQQDRKLTVLEISPMLALLPAGKPDPDPMSALTSERMRRVIEEAAAKFDWVVLDTPPVGVLPDAHLLAAMVNVAVLVVQAGRTPCALIQRAIESLDRARIVGVVLNRVEDRALSPGGYYEHYYAASYGRAADYRTGILS